MDLGTFFEHFDTLAEAPNGIQRLRELILDLAVRGKLVPQDPEDEPAQLIVKNVCAKKEALYAQKQLRRQKTIPPIEDDDQNFSIPNGWEWSRLGDISVLITDGTHHTPTYQNSGVPFISVKDISSGKLNFSNTKFIDHEEHLEINKRCDPEKGDILICRIGTLGKAVVVNTHEKFSLFVSVGLIKLSSDIDSDFLGYTLNSPFLISQYEEIKAGGSHTNKLNLRDIPTLKIPLPSLAEQKRIVAKVDELMGLCDALEAAQQNRNTLRQGLRASALDALMNAAGDAELETSWAFVRDNWRAICDRPEDVEGLRQVVIQLAVRGKAVPALTSKVLVRDKSVESQHLKKKNSLKVFPIDDYPFDLPEFWKWYRLGNLLDSLKYGTSKKCSHSLTGTPIIRIPNIDVKAGKIKNSDLKFTQLSDKELSNLRLRKDDLLMIRSNGSASLVGRSAVVESDMIDYGYAGYLVRLRLLEGLVFSRYLRLTLESMNVRWQIEFPIRTTSGVKNINSTEISNLLIPLPPLAEQKRIVAKVDELMQLCDQLEESLRSQQQQAEALTASAISHLAT